MAAGADITRDPRWVKLHGAGVDCPCGQHHVGLLTLTMLTPAGWPGEMEYETDEALRMEGDFLSPLFCVREGKYFALRMSLPVRVKGATGPASMFYVWASLDRPDFEGYVATKNAGKLDDKSRAQARLVNRIAGLPDTFGLMGMAIQQTDGPPLLLVLHDPDSKGTAHPLIADQRQGIDFDKLLEIYAANGHDFRPNLRSN